VLSGGPPGAHKIEGIGIGYTPPMWDPAVVDEIVPVRDEDALATALRLTREEGLLVRVSAGANVWAAVGVAERLGRDRVVVTVLPDTGERYLSVNLGGE
jgi:cysteine synthase A